MITRDEIEAKAKQFEINSSNVQRDYVFGWILSGLFTISGLKDVLFLKGGNGLRKGYFENTRFSTDLDFGIPGDITEERLRSELNKVCDFIQVRAGVTFVTEDTRVEEKFVASETPLPDLKVYEARLYFKDFYGKADHIRLKIAMDVTRFDRVLLPIQSRDLIHPYSDAKQVKCVIRCMKLEEIVATKLKCLLQRQHAPDLFDYVYAVKQLGGELNRDEVVRTFIQKTIFGRSPQTLKSILVAMPFDYFRTYWVKTVVCAKAVLFGVDEAIKLFVEDLEALFSPFPAPGYAQFAYFGPDLRGPIMQAGRDQTLLRIRYTGADRLIEPYSLKYLQSRTGDQEEYLFVYNVSGGNSAPGIRSLVAENVQSIENTDQKFEPRHSIELCKSGERPENPYLFDPSKPTKAPRGSRRSVFGSVVRPRRAPSSGIKYIYQCTYCGFRSTKSKQSSVLGPHKRKGSSYPCPGRAGYYVTSHY